MRNSQKLDAWLAKKQYLLKPQDLDELVVEFAQHKQSLSVNGRILLCDIMLNNDNFSLCDFSKLEMVDIQFQNTQIGRNNFLHLLRQAEERPVSFMGLSMEGVNLQNVNLNIKGVWELNLAGALLDGFSLLSAVHKRDSIYLNGCNIQNLVLQGEEVYDHLLGIQGNYLFNDLSGVNMRNAKCQNVKFFGVDFSHSDLSGSDFSHAQLIACKFKYSTLHNVNFSNSNLTHSDFTEADFSMANMYNAVV